VGAFRRTEELSLAEWNRVISINLTGTFLVTRAALPHLLEDGGVVINTSSTAGVMGQPYSAAYCASKGGVSLMTRALAVEFADRGVRVNAVAPGGVDTPILWDFGFPEGANPKLLDRIMSPMGYSTPAEIAGAFAYLASDEAAYISGAILSMDGTVTA
jgi:NAD(P)-dependent dehydrogenase (short-subunit alcohol dehydrogenase family)